MKLIEKENEDATVAFKGTVAKREPAGAAAAGGSKRKPDGETAAAPAKKSAKK